MRGGTPRPAEIYQIKVTLRHSRPPIWRRILVKSDTTLAKFHRTLQRVMGWEDAHLHQFMIRSERYGAPDREESGPRKAKDEREYHLGGLGLTEGSQFAYNYDFGDNWEHVLVIERTVAPEQGIRYPVCLAGARACPPEDVGGIPGYEEFLRALNDPNHPEHEEFLEWIGGTFDPEAFDVAEVNRLLRALR